MAAATSFVVSKPLPTQMLAKLALVSRSALTIRVPPLPEPGLPGPAPRKVQCDVEKSTPWPLIEKVPAVSSTTCSAGQAASALLMASVSSPPLGDSVRKMVVRAGMAPVQPGGGCTGAPGPLTGAYETPGCHSVTRSAGSV
jgi:hypothetical protein